MAIGAVLCAIVAILVGVLVLGDVATQKTAIKRLAATHIAVALTGVVILFVALINVSQGTGWASLVVLAAAGGLGLATLSRTRSPVPGQEPDEAKPEPEPEEHATGDEWALPEQSLSAFPGNVPVSIVVIHGAAALLTVLLVLLALSSGAFRNR